MNQTTLQVNLFEDAQMRVFGNVPLNAAQAGRIKIFDISVQQAFFALSLAEEREDTMGEANRTSAIPTMSADEFIEHFQEEIIGGLGGLIEEVADAARTLQTPETRWELSWESLGYVMTGLERLAAEVAESFAVWDREAAAWARQAESNKDGLLEGVDLSRLPAMVGRAEGELGTRLGDLGLYIRRTQRRIEKKNKKKRPNEIFLDSYDAELRETVSVLSEGAKELELIMQELARALAVDLPDSCAESGSWMAVSAGEFATSGASCDEEVEEESKNIYGIEIGSGFQVAEVWEIAEDAVHYVEGAIADLEVASGEAVQAVATVQKGKSVTPAEKLGLVGHLRSANDELEGALQTLAALDEELVSSAVRLEDESYAEAEERGSQPDLEDVVSVLQESSDLAGILSGMRESSTALVALISSCAPLTAPKAPAKETAVRLLAQIQEEASGRKARLGQTLQSLRSVTKLLERETPA